ncbi:hypothetical protein Pla108_21590 [Botrimarina colliarenosi]|uniref:PEP-CTERM protein-sorting domain-containing protein n=1 Tax=Botrimarina colliarenosi TaxID=2528001 RepID=A0A5C6ADG2_9BACT|nr:hypothetical protein [Botrimarina colliarenosi]TWT98004.1 hypothetical protein Pla108_21590 [Botrimarina colliarenosi]
MNEKNWGLLSLISIVALVALPAYCRGDVSRSASVSQSEIGKNELAADSIGLSEVVSEPPVTSVQSMAELEYSIALEGVDPSSYQTLSRGTYNLQVFVEVLNNTFEYGGSDYSGGLHSARFDLESLGDIRFDVYNNWPPLIVADNFGNITTDPNTWLHPKARVRYPLIFTDSGISLWQPGYVVPGDTDTILGTELVIDDDTIQQYGNRFGVDGRTIVANILVFYGGGLAELQVAPNSRAQSFVVGRGDGNLVATLPKSVIGGRLLLGVPEPSSAVLVGLVVFSLGLAWGRELS